MKRSVHNCVVSQLLCFQSFFRLETCFYHPPYPSSFEQDLNGRLLTVNKAARKGSRPPPRVSSEPRNRIYVGNLPWSADDARLEQLFSEYGKVVSARVVSDRETGRSRGFGFVVLSSEAEMNDAIANLDKHVSLLVFFLLLYVKDIRCVEPLN